MRFKIISFLLAATCCVHLAKGHGTPIELHPDGGLVAGGGVSDALGFAPTMYFEAGDTGDPFATLTLPTIGPVTIWQLPGLNISGLDPAASLSIEVLTRPVNNTLPAEARTLWYWNPSTGKVQESSAPMYLLGTGQRFVTIAPDQTSPLLPFLLVNQVGGTAAQGGQQGFHNHGLLSYALDNDSTPAAAPGAYAFFAKLTSNGYAPSNPFLVVFNFGVDYDQMAVAAAAINQAAFLPGDFNHDDEVNAADYVVWRHSNYDVEQYALWRGAFGEVFPFVANLPGANPNTVPEPMGYALLSSALFFALVRRGRRCSSTSLLAAVRWALPKLSSRNSPRILTWFGTIIPATRPLLI